MEHLLLGNNAQYFKYPFRVFAEAQPSCGVSAVDLTLLTPHVYVDSEEFLDCSDAVKLLRENRIKVYSVTPMPYRYSICASPNSLQRQKTLEYYTQCIRYAAFCGAKYLCITGAGADYDVPETELLSRACAMLKLLVVEAEKQGVTLLLGTVLGHESPYNETTPVLTTLRDVELVLNAVNSPALQAYLDTLPMSLTGETIPQWFAALESAICLVRFVDGNYNGYRLWGQGCLPCRKYLRQLQECGYTGPLSLNLPGERYSLEPQSAEESNLSTLRRAIE